MSSPSDPLAAATHPNPYPYYAGLRADRPLYRDSALGLWVASSAGAVTLLLTSPACRVRPTAEPVPRALVGSDAGDLFRRLIRMNDGDAHASPKLAIGRALAEVPSRKVMERSTALSRRWLSATPDATVLSDWAARLAVYVMADLLGWPESELPALSDRVWDFVRCLSPLSTPEQLTTAAHAAAMLRECLWDRLRQDTVRSDGLAETMAEHAARVGWSDLDGMVANLVGLLSQACEATAGLIGNTLLALADEDGLQDLIRREPEAVSRLVEEVSRHDAPIQNTRRFLAGDLDVLGQTLRAGDSVLLVLASANRDPQANPHPERLLIEREHRRVFSFGHGVHQCPGQRLALDIAASGVGALLRTGFVASEAIRHWSYQPSLNARIPCFANAAQFQHGVSM